MRALAAVALLLASLAAQAAEVTVIRPRAFIGEDSPYYIMVDGKLASDIEAREHVRFRVPAGRHTLAVRCPKPLYGTYAETASEQQIGTQAATFVIEPKYDCVTISAADARSAASLLPNTRLRAANKPSSYVEGKVEGGAAPAAAVAAAPQPAAAREEIGALTAAWVDAFNSRDPARIVALYDSEAVLIGTSAKAPAVGAGAIAAHFRDVPGRPMNRVALGEHTARQYGDTAIDSGLYSFFEVQDGKATVAPARYTFVYRKRDGKWRIVEHHSSRVP